MTALAPVDVARTWIRERLSGYASAAEIDPLVLARATATALAEAVLDAARPKTPEVADCRGVAWSQPCPTRSPAAADLVRCRECEAALYERAAELATSADARAQNAARADELRGAATGIAA